MKLDTFENNFTLHMKPNQKHVSKYEIGMK